MEINKRDTFPWKKFPVAVSFSPQDLVLAFVFFPVLSFSSSGPDATRLEPLVLSTKQKRQFQHKPGVILECPRKKSGTTCLFEQGWSHVQESAFTTVGTDWCAGNQQVHCTLTPGPCCGNSWWQYKEVSMLDHSFFIKVFLGLTKSTPRIHRKGSRTLNCAFLSISVYVIPVFQCPWVVVSMALFL